MSLGTEIVNQAHALIHNHKVCGLGLRGWVIEVSDEGRDAVIATSQSRLLREALYNRGVRLMGLPMLRHPALTGGQVRLREL